jgi:hypothetical protein
MVAFVRMHFSLAVLAGLLPLAFTLPFNTGRPMICPFAPDWDVRKGLPAETNAQFKVFRAPELSAGMPLSLLVRANSLTDDRSVIGSDRMAAWRPGG